MQQVHANHTVHMQHTGRTQGTACTPCTRSTRSTHTLLLPPMTMGSHGLGELLGVPRCPHRTRHPRVALLGLWVPALPPCHYQPGDLHGSVSNLGGMWLLCLHRSRPTGASSQRTRWLHPLSLLQASEGKTPQIPHIPPSPACSPHQLGLIGDPLLAGQRSEIQGVCFTPSALLEGGTWEGQPRPAKTREFC